MLGDQRRKIKLLYTVDEILNLENYATTGSIHAANEIYEAVSAEKTRQECDSTWVYLCAISAVYDAGRLQGIREERLRNKRKLSAV